MEITNEKLKVFLMNVQSGSVQAYLDGKPVVALGLDGKKYLVGTDEQEDFLNHHCFVAEYVPLTPEEAAKYLSTTHPSDQRKIVSSKTTGTNYYINAITKGDVMLKAPGNIIYVTYENLLRNFYFSSTRQPVGMLKS